MHILNTQKIPIRIKVKKRVIKVIYQVLTASDNLGQWPPPLSQGITAPQITNIREYRKGDKPDND